MLTDVIGAPAMLEQTAEECSELAQACLKLSRYFRSENKVYATEHELYEKLEEEIADVRICLGELMGLHEYVTSSGEDRYSIADRAKVIDWEYLKHERMLQRLADQGLIMNREDDQWSL